jgi:AcrR family transcriptional regulator
VVVESKPRRARGALASATIVDAAIAVVTLDGLEGLTMRSVARALDVPVTSVHWHFRTRDDLIDAIAARMAVDFYRAVPVIAEDGAWDDELRTYLRVLRQQLLDKGAFLALSFDRVGALLQDAEIRVLMTERLEREVGVLVHAGLAPDDAHRIHEVCSTYVQGFVLAELSRAHARRPVNDNERLFLDPQAFPVLSQVTHTRTVTSPDPDAQFELGLDLLIESIRLRLDGTRRG